MFSVEFMYVALRVRSPQVYRREEIAFGLDPRRPVRGR